MGYHASFNGYHRIMTFAMKKYDLSSCNRTTSGALNRSRNLSPRNDSWVPFIDFLQQSLCITLSNLLIFRHLRFWRSAPCNLSALMCLGAHGYEWPPFWSSPVDMCCCGGEAPQKVFA